MESLATRFFTPEEQQQISETVHRVEQQTTGEVVPLVISASHAYPEALFAGTAILTFPCALLTTLVMRSVLWWQGEALWLFLLFFLLYSFPAFLLVRYSPPVLRLFLSPKRAETEVEQRAFTSFFAEGLHATREATGVLVYISVLERRVCILGDRGINERIAPGSWQIFVDQLTAGIREGRSCEALCTVIGKIGVLLQTHFPPRPDDRNELSDLLIVNSSTAKGHPGLLIK